MRPRSRPPTEAHRCAPSAALLVALAAAAASLSLAAASCRTVEVGERPPLVAPRGVLDVRHYLGSPVAGPVAALLASSGRPASASALLPDPGPPEQSLQALAAFVALEALPERLLDPLGARTRLLVADEGTDPIRPAALLLGGARIGAVPDARSFTADLLRGSAGRAARIGVLRGVIPPGVTVSFELARPAAEAPETPPSATPTAARAEAGRLRVALRRVVSEQGAPLLEASVEVAREGASARPDQPGRELIVAEPWPLEARTDFAVIAPVRLAGEEAGAIAIVCSVSPPPAPEGIDAARHRAALAACRADLARDAAMAKEPPGLRPQASLPRPDLEKARRALHDAAKQRAALFAIAQGAGARLAEDVALAGQEPLVATVCASVAAAISGGPPVKGAQPGWPVERAAIQATLERSRATEEIVSADLFLLRRLGAVAWAEEVLEAALLAATDIADFDRRVVASNRALLDDGQPSVRARAFEWLDLRGLAPDGYDPLAATEQRRAALERAGIATGAAGGGS